MLSFKGSLRNIKSNDLWL